MSINETTTAVVILGGGYAGILCANRLRSSLTQSEAARVRITLVNPTAEFHERIRLHQLAAGTIESAAKPLSSMLHSDVHVMVGRALRIDPGQNVVDVGTTDGIVGVRFDTLVYAIGSTPAMTTPGAEEHTFALGDPQGAAAARLAIATGTPGQRIVVVGAGFTGVETASEVADRHPGARVTLLSAGPIVAQVRPAARRSITRSLTRLGVLIRDEARVTSVEAGLIVLADGTTVDFDIALWTASFGAPELARVSGLATDAVGRLRVDEYLRCIDHPAVIGAGDAVVLPDSNGRHVRMGCAMALPLGAAAAGTILAGVRGTQPERVSVGFLLQCISLGRRDGYIQFVHADDSPRRVHLGGRIGAFIKEAVCKMTVNSPRKERTKAGAFWAPRGPRIAAARCEYAGADR
jgi:NADH:ubiquinone reductase (H+-translocating)